MLNDSNPRPGGRQPSGPDGEVRDKLMGFKYASTERDVFGDVLRRRGFPPTGTGVRQLLLHLAAEDEQLAA